MGIIVRIFALWLLLHRAVIAAPTIAEAGGQFNHLSRYAGSEAVEAVFQDSVIQNFLNTQFRLKPEWRAIPELKTSLIDVIAGQLVAHARHAEDPCLSQTLLSVSLNADDTVYLVLVRSHKIRVFHSREGVMTRQFKGHRFPPDVATRLKKIIRECKLKDQQLT